MQNKVIQTKKKIQMIKKKKVLKIKQKRRRKDEEEGVKNVRSRG